MSPSRDQEYYRQRAGELRAAATRPVSSENRETLINFAEDFDGLADEAELAERGREPAVTIAPRRRTSS
jgi:hypothetical protein